MFGRFSYEDGAYIAPTGAFSREASASNANKVSMSNDSSDNGILVRLDLQRGNALFGKSSTVQPKAIRAMLLIRY